ncbi:hypothetical protein [Miniphocaeibacter massiliensis]|uniref:hypothetical protein n=1 Tax=Miniphocaeibacter massiliensis TaxID=2041841 RepID=UPI000C1BC694|nr:hypothetical protein [Miniphocaeibacter massiliensis]
MLTKNRLNIVLQLLIIIICTYFLLEFEETFLFRFYEAGVLISKTLLLLYTLTSTRKAILNIFDEFFKDGIKLG